MSGNTAVMAVPAPDPVQAPDQDPAPALAAEAETTNLKDLTMYGNIYSFSCPVCFFSKRMFSKNNKNPYRLNSTYY